MRNFGEGRGTFGLRRIWRRLSVGMVCCLCVFAAGCFVAPNPISDEEQWQRTLDDNGSVFWGQDAPCAPVTLPEAIARAVKHNLDHRLALMESAFHMKQLDAANMAMLPRLALNAGYSWRSNESASSSMSYRRRQENLEPSFSTETHHTTADLSFSWTMLDFGLSYFQARQQADRFMILKERRRRIVNNLVKDVITEYFRVASAERVAPEIESTLAHAEEALAVYKRMEEEKKGSVAQALEHQRSLVSIISHLRQISMQTAAAKSRLAALMNLPLSTDYAVIMPVEGELKPPRLMAGLDELETIGVYLRPDLREELYQARIDKYEVKKEILKMIPGVNAFTSLNHDSNKYMVHEMWAEAGLRTTLDIVGMAQKWKQVKASKVQQEVTRHRRLAATIAAMVQINMGYYQYQQALEMLADSEKLNGIDNKLLEVSRASARARETGALDQVRQAAVALNSRLDRDRHLIDVLTAWSNLYFSIGGDILGDIHGTEDVATLTCVASRSLAEWLSGVLPELPGEAPTLPGGGVAEPYYLTAILPPVLAPSEEMKREAEEAAKRRAEEEEADSPKATARNASRGKSREKSAKRETAVRVGRDAASEQGRRAREKNAAEASAPAATAKKDALRKGNRAGFKQERCLPIPRPRYFFLRRKDAKPPTLPPPGNNHQAIKNGEAQASSFFTCVAGVAPFARSAKYKGKTTIRCPWDKRQSQQYGA